MGVGEIGSVEKRGQPGATSYHNKFWRETPMGAKEGQLRRILQKDSLA